MSTWYPHTLSPKHIMGYKFLLIKDCYETDQLSCNCLNHFISHTLQ